MNDEEWKEGYDKGYADAKKLMRFEAGRLVELARRIMGWSDPRNCPDECSDLAELVLKQFGE